MKVMNIYLAFIALPVFSYLTFSVLSYRLQAPIDGPAVGAGKLETGARSAQPELGDCCLRRINKVMNGDRKGQFSTSYGCDTGRTSKGVTKVTLTINSAICDKDVTVPDGSRLEASCTTIRQSDQFGHSICDFTIKHPVSGATHFSGTMVLIDRASQPKPTGCRKCNAFGFLEGWIDGVGQGTFAPFKLQAVVTARATIPTDNRSTIFTGDLNGTLLKCP